MIRRTEDNEHGFPFGMVNRLVGVVRSITERTLWPGEASFFHYAVQMASTAAFGCQSNFAYGGGASTSRIRARQKAIGEGIERYCSAFYCHDDLPLCSAADADFETVEPASFALYSRVQYESTGFPYVRFDEHTPIRWASSVCMRSKRTVRVPAATTYLPYMPQGEDECAITQNLSTGLACHVNYDRAAISAICEVIERDAFTISWQQMLKPTKISNSSLPASLSDLVRRFELSGVVVNLMLLPTDVRVPVFMCVLENQKPDWPPFCFAAACDVDPIVGARKCLEEAAHTNHYMHYCKLNNSQRIDNVDEVSTQGDHIQFWCADERRGDVGFILESPDAMAFDDIHSLFDLPSPMGLSELHERVEDVGASVYLAELTTPDIAGLGCRVIRASIPSFHPLFFGFDLRALGSQRLHSVPIACGQAAQAEGVYNALPHPFP